MLSFESVALELLEYKVRDLLAGRPTRGGSAAARKLLEHLQRAAAGFDAAGQERLRELEQSLNTATRRSTRLAGDDRNLDGIFLTETTATAGAAPVNPLLRAAPRAVRLVDEESLAGVRPDGTGEATDPRLVAEQLGLRELARQVWWRQLDGHVRREAAALRAEKGRYTARLLFATHRNLLRWAAHPESRQDARLAGFRVQEMIPARDDALVSVDDTDSLGELIREILTMTMELGRPGSPLAGLSLPRRDSLSYMRAAALRVAEDPYAGRVSPAAGRRTGSRELRLALRELERERLPAEEHARQRGRLEERLHEALNSEREERVTFDRTVRMFTSLMRAFFQKIAYLLPESVGGEAPLPRLEGGVIGSRNPLLATDTVPATATAVTVKTTAPASFRLAGLDFRLHEQAGMKSLNAGGREVRLEPYFTVDTDRGRLEGYTAGDWLHLRFEEQEKSLAKVLAEALAVHHCAHSPEWPDLRLMLGVLANSAASDPRELVGKALERLAQLSANVPKRRAAIDGFMRGSARAARVGISDRALAQTVSKFHTALSVGRDDLPALLKQSGSAEAAVHGLGSGPLEFRLGGQHLTVRRHHGHLDGENGSYVVLLPGRTLGTITDMLLEPLAGGTLVMARAGRELAALWLRTGDAADSAT